MDEDSISSSLKRMNDSVGSAPKRLKEAPSDDGHATTGGGDLSKPRSKTLSHLLPASIEHPKPRLDHAIDLSNGVCGAIFSCKFEREISAMMEVCSCLADIGASVHMIKEHREGDTLEPSTTPELTPTATIHAFRPVKTTGRGVIFLRPSEGFVGEPLGFVLRMLDGIMAKERPRFRFVQRITPVSNTCDQCLDNIEETARKCAEDYWSKHSPPATGVKFAVVLHRRGANHIDRGLCIRRMAGVLKRISPASEVDLKQPDVVLILEMFSANGKDCTAVSVIPSRYVTSSARGLLMMNVGGG